MPRPVAYVAQVQDPSAELIDKLLIKHDGITLDEVREAVVLTDVERSVWDWDDDPFRGWRLLIVGRTALGRKLLVVLYPVDEGDGLWRLGTAMRK